MEPDHDPALAPVPPAPPPPSRRELARRALALTDDALLALCEEEFFVASGPGGQHRNKTASGVRLTHPPTGLTVTATERRSQAQNRSMALERLREVLKPLTFVPKVRKATKPSKGSKRRRLEGKKKTSEKKALRRDKSGW